MKTVEAWVDGSFNKVNNYYGWAYAIRNGAKFDTACGADNRASDFWNVAGELSAVMHLIYSQTRNGYDKKFIIHHDYQGISTSAEGKWKTKNAWTKKYREECSDKNSNAEYSLNNEIAQLKHQLAEKEKEILF